MLISSYADRIERVRQKRSTILEFLLNETWTGFSIAKELLAISDASTLRTLCALERDGLIRRHFIADLRVSLWGITQKGVVMHGFGCPTNSLGARHWQVFEPSKLKPLGIAHKLALQQARLRANNAGWTDWRTGAQMGDMRGIQPDATTQDLASRRIAIELERTVKTRKRYEGIFSAYFRLIKDGQIDLVHYLCPDAELAPRLARLFASIDAVPVLNERVQLNARHRAKILVFSLADWPCGGGFDILS